MWGKGKTIPNNLAKTIHAAIHERVMTVNERKHVESSDVKGSGGDVGGETDDAGLSHARLGIDGKRVKDIAATKSLCQMGDLTKRGRGTYEARGGTVIRRGRPL